MRKPIPLLAVALCAGAAKHDVVDMGCFETDFRREQGIRIFVQ